MYQVRETRADISGPSVPDRCTDAREASMDRADGVRSKVSRTSSARWVSEVLEIDAQMMTTLVTRTTAVTNPPAKNHVRRTARDTP